MKLPMPAVAAAEFENNVGRYQEAALRQPVTITRNGSEHLVMMSAEECRRLTRGERRVPRVGTETDPGTTIWI